MTWADASVQAAGAPLMQLGDDSKSHVIEYYSKLFTKAELKYSVAERMHWRSKRDAHTFLGLSFLHAFHPGSVIP